MLRLCVVPLVASFFVTFTTQRGIATPSPSNAIVNVLKRLPVGKAAAAAREITTKAQLVGLAALLTATLTTAPLPAHEVAQQPAANRVQLETEAFEASMREYNRDVEEIMSDVYALGALLGVDLAPVILLPRPPILPRDPATVILLPRPPILPRVDLAPVILLPRPPILPRDATISEGQLPAEVAPLAQLSGVNILNHPTVGATVIFAPDFALPIAGEPTWGSFPRILDGGDLQYLYGEVEMVFSDGYYLVNVTHNYYDAPGAFARNFRTIVHSSNIEAYDD